MKENEKKINKPKKTLSVRDIKNRSIIKINSITTIEV